MPECTNCGNPVDEPDNFCSNCGEPRNESARNRLNQLVDEQTGDTTQLSDREEMIVRVSYALGFVFVVAGISVIPNLGGIPILLGGVLLFPPVRLLSARVFGAPLKVEANAVIAVFFVLIGAVVTAFL